MDWRSALVRAAVRRLRVGEDVVRHLTTFQRLGERFEVEAPAEVVSIGARTLVRALRTRSAAQIRPDWRWPTWLERQLDPASPAFVPRGHLPFAHNVTGRNWTAIGDLAAEREATVDPVGLVTPEPDGWSLEWWVRADGRWWVPGRHPVEQRLVDALPIVETELPVGGGSVVHRAYAAGSAVAVEVTNRTAAPIELALAVRPYNVEGLAVVEELAVEPAGRILVAGEVAVTVDGAPTRTAASTFRHGDSHRVVVDDLPAPPRAQRVTCPAGLAQGAVVVEVAAGATARAVVPLRPAVTTAAPLAEVRATWQAALDRGLRVRLPDARLQEAVEANRAAMLVLHDPGSITPGPATYHRFWFRDAAYQIAALDRWGFHDEAADVLATYPDRQLADGAFFSQWREWDANGAALWIVAEHHRLTGDDELLRRLLPAVRAGVNWIERTRDPLLPPGVSAEHLGPYDYYFWDDLWGIAGMLAGAEIARRVGELDAAVRVERAASRFRADLDAAIARAAGRTGRRLIPAGPNRGVDAAMIGSLAACVPLRLMPADDPMILGTVEAIRAGFTVGDAFYQGISHTGRGTYLTLQLAAVELELGDLRAWRRLSWLLDAATPTWTWPEAIHPTLDGGCMGDGHHGWAAADLLSFVRSVLVREVPDGTVALLGILPPTWVGGDLEVAHAPTHHGVLSYALRWDGDRSTLAWEWESGGARLTAPGLDPAWTSSDRAGEVTLTPTVSAGSSST